ncbi:MAG: hypothetical protein ACOCV2_11575 [Persicimonas sp.]
MRYVEEVQERLQIKLDDAFTVERSSEHFLTIKREAEPRLACWYHPTIWWLSTFVAFDID